MSSFAGSIAGLFVCGMVGGYAGLCLLAPTPEAKTAVARVAEPPAMPTTVGLTVDPAIRAAAPAPESDDVAAAPATPDPAPVATGPVAKARTATHTNKARALGAVPSNAYAYDGSARRYRQSQGSFFGFGGGGFFR
jgi:hypothetical protein